MYALLRPLLFAMSPSAAHHAGLAALSALDKMGAFRALIRPSISHDPRLAVKTLGLVFPNPIGVAGGFDKDARCPRALEALGFGHVELGTVTAVAQAENPRPNMFRLPADRALVNRLGFPNAGAHALAERLKRARPTVPVGVSIGKSRVVSVDDQAAVIADYRTSFAAVRGVADFVVVNVSSPNTPNLRAMQRADSAEALLRALLETRGTSSLPLLLKVAPDLDTEAYDALLDVVKRVGLDGVVATNTTIARDGLATPAARIAEIGAGGLSGPPLRERSRAMVKRAREALGNGPTIIGVGGVATADDVRAMRGAGANLVQLYTSFVYEGPRLVARLCRELVRA